MKHAPQALLQPLMKFKWIKAIPPGSQLYLGLGWHMVAFQKLITRILGLVMLAFDFRSLPTFGLQLGRW